MIIGAAWVELHVHGSQSLKTKRGAVRAISQRVRNRFNVSVAEVEGEGTWQRAVLGLTTVGRDARSVRLRLDKAVEFIENLFLAEVVDSEVELLATPLSAYQDDLDPLGEPDDGNPDDSHDPDDDPCEDRPAHPQTDPEIE